GNEPAVRDRVAGVANSTMLAIADTVAGDTGLDRARAELLSVALSGAGQVAARWWLDGDRPVPKAEAIRLIESLLWRGISNFPLHHGVEGDAGEPPA
ncbi:MAG TPA: hypothetical protein VK816_11695, partial [Jatrophihabitantaceae bacterium]|nr:hypothetical protein [Jatrophihabitantaceae bacterium]